MVNRSQCISVSGESGASSVSYSCSVSCEGVGKAAGGGSAQSWLRKKYEYICAHSDSSRMHQKSLRYSKWPQKMNPRKDAQSHDGQCVRVVSGRDETDL